MEENFLHYTWKYKLFNQENLFTTTGERIEILKTGEHNHQSGPDFFNTRLRVNGTLWAGNLEIHVHSSEWRQHKHQFDTAYDNVVLHVVYEHDEEIVNSRGKEIPTLELKGRIPLEYFRRYSNLKESKNEIACSKNISEVPELIMHGWLQRLVIERMEEKTKLVNEILLETNNDWEETFYRALAKNFGFKTNAQPFYLLAKNLPLRILLKHADNPLQTEALLFGQAGMLDEQFAEKYPQKLQNEYEFLKNKYSLLSMKKSTWKLGRMRPANFPSIRIAQFASLVKEFNGIFSRIKEIENTELLDRIFNTEPAQFWIDHYSFVTKSPSRCKRIGHDGIENIAINTIVPIVFLYGVVTRDVSYKERAIQLLEQLCPEDNAAVRMYKVFGVSAGSASQTQALLQLKNNYCDKKNCLNCRVGYHVWNGREKT